MYALHLLLCNYKTKYKAGWKWPCLMVYHNINALNCFRLQTEKLKLDRELSEVMAKHKSLERQYRDLRSQVDHVCLTYGKPDQGLDDLMKGYEQEQHRLQALLQQQQLQLQEAEMGRQAAEDRTSHLQHSLNTSLHQLSDK